MTNELTKEDWIILRLIIVSSELAMQTKTKRIPLDALASLSHLMDKFGYEIVRDATRALLAERQVTSEQN